MYLTMRTFLKHRALPVCQQGFKAMLRPRTRRTEDELEPQTAATTAATTTIACTHRCADLGGLLVEDGSVDRPRVQQLQRGPVQSAYLLQGQRESQTRPQERSREEINQPR